MELYKSPYEAYPFLSDDSEDLRCDFELFTDEMASRTGLLRAKVQNKALQAELLWICELLYHINPTLRTKLTVTEAEKDQLLAAVQRLKDECKDRCKLFVLTQGCEAACTAHILRVQGKGLVRLLYRYHQQGHTVPPLLLDIANLLSGYFFYLALKLNQLAGVNEIAYTSRNYT
ncbi:ATP--cob(I)alamin adenosyltransferase [Ruminococcaceae bacterium OttesenSCG-928-A16]|nr:ATP--cob(I)alamin adenosyltransferase [Ruminococcaceae bacterium OttesenSCG-928-A16]